MNKKSIIVWIIIVIVVGVGAFFGGSAYGQSQAASSRGSYAAGQGRGTFAGRTGTTGATGSATAGTILSASTSTLTIQLRTGSTQIIFLSTSTPIIKTTSGSVTDLAPGDQIIVTGTTNSDGSLTATNIQIRPAMTSTSTQASSTATQY